MLRIDLDGLRQYQDGPGVGSAEAVKPLGEVYSPDGGLVGVWGAKGYLRLPTLISSATEKRS